MGNRRRGHKKRDGRNTPQDRRARLDAVPGPHQRAEGGNIESKPSENANNDRDSKVRRPMELVAFLMRLRDPIAFFTAMIFLATAAYAIVSICQLWALFRSNEYAYRAWLTVKEARRIILVEGRPLELEIIVQNTGRSPAQDVVATNSVVFKKRGESISDGSKRPSGPTTHADRYVVGPGQTTDALFLTKDTMTAQTIEALRDGSLIVYFMGETTYSDQFSSDRSLTFCFLHDPSSVTSLRPCQAYNAVR